MGKGGVGQLPACACVCMVYRYMDKLVPEPEIVKTSAIVGVGVNGVGVGDIAVWWWR